MSSPFTRYEKFVIGVLAFLQFTIVVDFMIMAPLGPILIPSLSITPAQFGLVVSAYAFSAGASGLLSAGFADRFDRKRMLLFFYAGFVIGTLFCAIAPTYPLLLLARMFTGVFGGVLGSIVYAITTDIFAMKVRGRVMGVVQSSFAASQVMGIPLGLYLSNKWGWHAPFLMIVGVSSVVGVLIAIYMRPVNAHLGLHPDRNPIHHLWATIINPRHAQAFMATGLLVMGGFMLMPFASVFNVNNVGIPYDDLPWVFMVTGGFSIFTGPWIGRLADQLGKYKVFFVGSTLTMIMVFFYTHLGPSPIWLLMFVNILLFMGVSTRIISASALTSAVPAPADRGAFMSISSSIQQIAGGMGSAVAGWIVVQEPSGKIDHYDILGFVVIGAMVFAIVLMKWIDRMVSNTVAY